MALCKYFNKLNNNKETFHIKRAVNFVCRQDVVNSEILTTRLDEFWWTSFVFGTHLFFFFTKNSKECTIETRDILVGTLQNFFLHGHGSHKFMFMHADNKYMWIVNNALRLHCMNLNNCALLCQISM